MRIRSFRRQGALDHGGCCCAHVLALKPCVDDMRASPCVQMKLSGGFHGMALDHVHFIWICDCSSCHNLAARSMLPLFRPASKPPTVWHPKHRHCLPHRIPTSCICHERPQRQITSSTAASVACDSHTHSLMLPADYRSRNAFLGHSLGALGPTL